MKRERLSRYVLIYISTLGLQITINLLTFDRSIELNFADLYVNLILKGLLNI